MPRVRFAEPARSRGLQRGAERADDHRGERRVAPAEPRSSTPAGPRVNREGFPGNPWLMPVIPSSALGLPTLPQDTATSARPGALRMNEPSEADPLIARAAAGDQAAFQQLFRQHRDTVARVVHRFLGPSHELEDVVQDVFVHVYRSLPSFRGDSKFSTWLYRLTANVTKMHLRKKRSRPRFADVPVPETREDSPQERPDDVAERNERVEALYRLLDRLAEKKRTVLVLHDLEGLAAKDIAEIVDAPVLTVRTRLFYARKELYAALAEEPALASVVARFLDELPGRPAAEAEDTSSERASKGART